jgi:hypothetical protein
VIAKKFDVTSLEKNADYQVLQSEVKLEIFKKKLEITSEKLKQKDHRLKELADENLYQKLEIKRLKHDCIC